MAFQRGIKSYIGLGKESSWGSAATISRFLRQISASLDVSEAKINQEALYRVPMHSDENVQGMINAGGDINFIPQYSNPAWTMLLEQLLGSVSTLHVDPTGDTAAYMHTFTPADSLPTGLTIEVVTESNGRIFTGCNLTSGRFAIAAGAPLRFAGSFIAKDATKDTSPPALSDVIGNMIVCTEATLTWNGSQAKVLDAELTVENPMERAEVIGQRYPDQPDRSDNRRVLSRFNVRFEDYTLYDDFRAATERALVIDFTSALKPGSVYPYRMNISLPVSKILGTPIQADRKGPLVLPITAQSFVNGSNASEIIIKVWNGNSAAV